MLQLVIDYIDLNVITQGKLCTTGIMMNDKLANAPYEDFIPQIANITDPAIREQVGDSIGKFYFDGAPVTSKTGENLDRVFKR